MSEDENDDEGRERLRLTAVARRMLLGGPFLP
jgi:hypothetical protein